MKRFQMPESMKLACIWVVWIFLAIGALGWALFVVLDAFGVKDQAAAWVQAIGSIAGIAIAIYVPYMQKLHAEKVRRDEAIDASISSQDAALILIDHHINLMKRIISADLGSYTKLSDLEKLELADDLKRNRREIESLGIDALGSELIAYLLMVKRAAGYGGFYAEQIMELANFDRSKIFKNLEWRVSRLQRELEKAVTEIEELTETARRSRLG